MMCYVIVMYDPFEFAIIRFATFAPSRPSPEHLVFASVEFLLPERKGPVSSPIDIKKLRRSKSGLLNYRRIGTSAKNALNWYRGAMDTLPEFEGAHRNAHLRTSRLLDEPTIGDGLWSWLATPIPPIIFPGINDDDRPEPFAGAHQAPLRIHRRLSVGDPALNWLRSDLESLEWLRRRIWVDFAHYPELIGSAALMVPDPDISGVEMRLDRDESGAEAVIFEVNAHGEIPQGLAVCLSEERYGTVAWQKTHPIPPDGKLRVACSQPISQVAYTLIHTERGVIATAPATGFMRAFNNSAIAIGREIRVEMADGRRKNAPVSIRSVQEQSSAQGTTIGTPLSLPGRWAFGRKKRREARHLGAELWLDDPQTARDQIWGMVGQARQRVCLIDPYADGKELQEFGLGSSGAKIRLMTANGQPNDRNFVALERGIETLTKLDRSVEVRIMSKKALHDRFLILDDVVWLLGHSLNSIGQKPSMLIRLRNPKPICVQLLRIWRSASPVEPSKCP